MEGMMMKLMQTRSNRVCHPTVFLCLLLLFTLATGFLHGPALTPSYSAPAIKTPSSIAKIIVDSKDWRQESRRSSYLKSPAATSSGTERVEIILNIPNSVNGPIVNITSSGSTSSYIAGGGGRDTDEGSAEKDDYVQRNPSSSSSSSSPSRSKPKLVLKGLESGRFRHPLDQQATQQLKLLPGLEWLVRRFMAVIEEAVYLDNISSAILVGPNQMPALYNSLVESCRILDVPVLPELYIKQSAVPNAYCMAVQGKRPFIVIHTCLLDLMTPQELQVIIAHELGHIKCEHGVWITAANAVALGLYSLGGMLGRTLGDQIQGLLLAWLRAAEFSCDRAALLVAQDLDVVLSTFLKLVGGSKTQAEQLNATEFLKQARSYEVAVSTTMGRLLRSQMEPQLTHPLPVLRVRELDRWFNSAGYTSIVSRGIPLVEKKEGIKG